MCMCVRAGINPELLERIQLPVPNQDRSSYSQVLVERVIRIMNQAAQPGTWRDTHTHTHPPCLTCTFSLYCTLFNWLQNYPSLAWTCSLNITLCRFHRCAWTWLCRLKHSLVILCWPLLIFQSSDCATFYV